MTKRRTRTGPTRVPSPRELAAADRIEKIATASRRLGARADARGAETVSYALQAKGARLDAVAAEIRSDKPLSPETRDLMRRFGR